MKKDAAATKAATAEITGGTSSTDADTTSGTELMNGTAGDDAPPATAERAAEPEPAFHPDHEWPSTGGCYTRQPDGSLTRDED